MSLKYKLVVFVPLPHCQKVREALGGAGAGKIGNYSFCSFSSRGMGRFLPLDGAQPHVGVVGVQEEVEEERIEVTCDATVVENLLAALKRAHPYEEIGYDLYPLETRE